MPWHRFGQSGSLLAALLARRVQAGDSLAKSANHASLRLLTWNIGYAELEDDTRVHDKDMPAIAEVILREDPHRGRVAGTDRRCARDPVREYSYGMRHALLVTNGIKVYELTPVQESLEEAFLRLTHTVAAATDGR